MFEIGPQAGYALAAVGIMLLIGFPVHEYMHAYAAHRLGDNTARWQGRLTLDPRVHLDPLGAMMLVISALLSPFFLGWAKPTPVNPMNLRGGQRGEAVVAVAGPLSNLVMAAVVAIVVRLLEANAQAILGTVPFDVFNAVYLVIVYFVIINVYLFLFNLLPIPPLDGWRAALGLVSPRMNWQLRTLEARYAQFIPIIFLGFLIVGGGRILGPIADAILRILIG